MTTNDEPTCMDGNKTDSKSGDAIGSMVGASYPSSGTGYQTILSDPVNYHVKHPLQSHWTLHQKIGQVEGASSRGVTQDNWEKQLVQSVTIGTVEDFWCMQDVNTIPVNCDYFFMREGIKPMWEDPANKDGCELRLAVTRNLDAMNMWKMSLLAAVGCQFTDFEFITGVQFAFRANKNRISIWLAACPPEARERLSTLMEKASGTDAGSLRVEVNEFNKPEGGQHRGGDRRGDRGGPDRDGGRGWSRSGSGGGSGGRTSGSSFGRPSHRNGGDHGARDDHRRHL